MKRFSFPKIQNLVGNHKKGDGSLKCVQEDHLGELLKVQIPGVAPADLIQQI